MSKLFYLTITTVLLFAFSGCADGVSCTEIGCQDQIELAFQGPDGEPIEGFSGEITADGETISVTCGKDGIGSDTGYTCLRTGVVWLEVSGVDEISLNVRDADDSSNLAYIGGVEVTYSTVQPNGESCPPTCEQAEETVIMVPTQAGGS